MASKQLPMKGNMPLSEHDPVLHDIIEKEKNRQWKGLELIASENFTSRAVMDCLGSVLTNKYSEGYPGKRYYGGGEFVDMVEQLCIDRALEAYRLTPENWAVNVQPYSGSPANFAVYTGLLNPHDRIMGLGLPSGGHLTHGFYTAKKKVSATSVYFESLPYEVHHDTGMIDYDDMEKLARVFMPKCLVGGGSAYVREWDFGRMRATADINNSIFLIDMAHISGLVAAGEVACNPFDYADVVTSTTHKTLRGPRSGLIFFRKTNRVTGEATGFGEKIDLAVFPGLQGGPHNHQIGAVAVALEHAKSPEFKAYIQQVKKNACQLAVSIKDLGSKAGYKCVSDGTDNHMVLMDLRPGGVSGSKMQTVCDRCHITVNKNTVHGDKNAMNPSGIRLGTNVTTTRGMMEADMTTIAGFLIRCADLCSEIQEVSGKKLVDFNAHLDKEENVAKIAAIRGEAEAFAMKFEMPGFSVEGL